MNANSTTSDDDLAELLDAVLREARHLHNFDVEKWRQAHPQLNDEDVTLLDLLIDLSQSVEVWQQCDLEVSPDGDDLPGTSTLLMGRKSGRIGRYQLLRHVGSGSMGDVYQAHDPQLDRQVAVKVPRCDRILRDRNMFMERFIREARAAAAVRHASICPIYDAGDDDGQAYVVMAFVEGESLDNVLGRGRVEDIRKAVQIAIQVADALNAIHQHGIIHRDLKPGNILIDRDGQALLTDFGLAISEFNSERITSDGLIIGTPVYMSPEQAAGENSKLTPAADLYSLGAVLYEMLTGQAPFRAPLPELLRKIMLQRPVSPIEVRPDIDPQLSTIVEQSLEKIPADRFKSAAALGDALREWLGSMTSVVASHPEQSTTSKWTSRRLFRRSAAVAAVMCVMIAVSLSLPKRTGETRDIAAMTTASASRGTPSASHITPANPVRLNGTPVVPTELNGRINITVSSNPERGPMKKTRLPATEKGALPIHTGEIVRFEVQLNQPAHIYLLWVSPDGNVEPIYPWDSEHHAGWDAPHLANSDRANDHVMCPLSPDRGFEVVEPAGLQTVVLLARRQPLDQKLDLAQVLSGLPSTPILAMNSTPGPILRGLKTGQTQSIEDPQFDELKTRLSPHFELMRVVSFPQISAADTNAGHSSADSGMANNAFLDFDDPSIASETKR
jgi:serine/threonine protein kinase